MSQVPTPINLLKRAASALLQLPEDHPEVLAIAVAWQDSVYDLCEALRLRYGQVTLEVSDGWLERTTVTRSRKVAPEHRRVQYRSR